MLLTILPSQKMDQLMCRWWVWSHNKSTSRSLSAVRGVHCTFSIHSAYLLKNQSEHKKLSWSVWIALIAWLIEWLIGWMNEWSITFSICRILKDHSDSSGLQSQALDSIREKLVESENILEREKESFKVTQVCYRIKVSQTLTSQSDLGLIWKLSWFDF